MDIIAFARRVEGIAKGRHWLSQLTSGEVNDTKEIAKRERCSDRSVRMTLSLAFVSPQIAKAAIDGSLPSGGVAPLTELPAECYATCICKRVYKKL
jgi:hypothetical protein